MTRDEVTAEDICRALARELCQHCNNRSEMLGVCNGCLAMSAYNRAQWLETQRNITARERGE